MSRDLHDHYFHEAKRHGYLSRAAFKLTEIDDKRHVLPKRGVVLDCGCAPGSWLQVAAERLGRKGTVIGIDLKAITHDFDHDKHARDGAEVHVLQGDLTTTDIDTFRELLPPGVEKFDTVLSDMAPNTSGDRIVDHHRSVRLCHAVLDLAIKVLKPRGDVVMKVLEGEAYPDLLARCADMFDKAKGFKPKASRNISTEMFIIAQGYRRSSDAEPSTDDAHALPKQPRPTGWG